jgi:hypothetical protein
VVVTKPRSAPAQQVGGRRYPTRGKTQRPQRERSHSRNNSDDEGASPAAKRVATGNCGPSMAVDSDGTPASNPCGVLDESGTAPSREVDMEDDPGSSDGGAAAGADAPQA